VEVINVSTNVPRKISNYTSCPKIEYNSQASYDPASRRLFTAAQHANSFAVLDVSDPVHPSLLGLLQDTNRTSHDELLAGATGCAFDSRRNVSFVASEFAKSFSIIDVSDSTAPKVLGQVRHPALSGEAIKYDAAKQVAYVVSRSAAALVIVDVKILATPKVIGVLSSKTIKSKK